MRPANITDFHSSRSVLTRVGGWVMKNHDGGKHKMDTNSSGPDFPYKGPYWAAETLPRGRDLTEDNLTLSLHFPYTFPYIFLTFSLHFSYRFALDDLTVGPFTGWFADLTAGPFTSSLRTLLRDLSLALCGPYCGTLQVDPHVRCCAVHRRALNSSGQIEAFIALPAYY